MTGPVIVEALLGVVLVLLGRWGVARAESLVSIAHDAAYREQLVRAYRRGARGCQIVGAAFLLLTLAAIVDTWR